MYNRAILMGRICHDLELKTTPSGLPVMSFRIAVERSYQTKGEERKTDFFNVVAWRATAEFISRYFSKGRMILIEGELQTRSYVDKNGATQNIVEIVVDSAHFTGEPKAGGSSPGSYQSGAGHQSSYNPGSYQSAPQSHPAEAQSTPPAMAQGSAKDFVESASDDDYPF